MRSSLQLRRHYGLQNCWIRGEVTKPTHIFAYTFNLRMKAANLGRSHPAFISRHSPGKSSEINSSRVTSVYLDADAMELTLKIYLRQTIIFASAHALQWKKLIVSQSIVRWKGHHQLGAFPSSFWESRSIREVRFDDVTIRSYLGLWDMSGGVGYRHGSDLNEKRS